MIPTALAPAGALRLHDHPINHVCYGGVGHTMGTADTNLRVKVWRDHVYVREYDLRSISDKVRPIERIRGIRFNVASNRLFAAAGEFVASYDLSSPSSEPDWAYIAPRLFAFLIVHPTSIAISRNDVFAASFENGSISIWDPRGGGARIIKHNAAPRILAFLPDDTIIGTDSFSVSLWHPQADKPLWHRDSKERIYGMAASSDGQLVALRKLFTTAVYDIASGEKVAEYKQGRGLPLVAFSPTSPILALGTQHAIHLLDPLGSTQASLALDDAELISLGFHPDGVQVVAGCSDGQVRYWDSPLRRASDVSEL